ncbi:hypothetical protein PUV54_02855 [Hyphococcus flavus]|uniref:Uncharacterized protein n=1 Tax=Hyphococcus flavus TaxID=1866326 RepID=A0AAE9ZK60_9PROT|nr:hypothetical protein [Hyphococcus flavus]WDI32130.1 hypothetical protein PUV54_02855 [Hyphococcus flavus]
MSTDRLEELRQVCETYGAELHRWPADVRKEFADLFQSDEAAAIRIEAQELDGFLNAATSPRMAEDLERRITANFVPPVSRTETIADLFRALAPKTRLIPAGAVAGLGAIGIATGMMTASAETTLTPESEALAYFESDIVLASLDEEEAAAWDAD